MNIIKAIKSGKPFRRKGCELWYISEGYAFYWINSNDKKYITAFSPLEIIAEDWEVKK